MTEDDKPGEVRIVSGQMDLHIDLYEECKPIQDILDWLVSSAKREPPEGLTMADSEWRESSITPPDKVGWYATTYDALERVIFPCAMYWNGSGWMFLEDGKVQSSEGLRYIPVVFDTLESAERFAASTGI